MGRAGLRGVGGEELGEQLAGHRTPAQGAAIAVRLATLPDDGPTGGCFEDAGTIPW